MNERIRELIKQYSINITIDGLGYGEGNVEGLAELIVQDCMAMCTELQAQYLTSRKSTMDFDEKNIYAEGEAACDILRHKMKKQFGVEL